MVPFIIVSHIISYFQDYLYFDNINNDNACFRPVMSTDMGIIGLKHDMERNHMNVVDISVFYSIKSQHIYHPNLIHSYGKSFIQLLLLPNSHRH